MRDTSPEYQELEQRYEGVCNTLMEVQKALAICDTLAELQKAYYKEPCTWTQDNDGNWWTTCKNAFTVTDGSPTANKMQFCCYCGKPLVEVPYVEPKEEGE